MLKLATKFRPAQKDFAQAIAAGFQNAELYLDSAVLDNTQAVADMAREFDLNYALHFPNRPNLSPIHLKECCRLFDELSCSAVVIHPPMLKRYGRKLKEIHPDIVLAIETMRVPRDELAEWAQQHKSVTLDMEHIWKFSLDDCPLKDFLQTIRRLFNEAADCVKHVHMPGYLPGHGEHRPMYTSREFCMGVFDILADFGFSGLVVSEVNLEFQNQHELQMDVLLYSHWLENRQKNASNLPAS